jgi:endonuclease/exonuclease/phosphatase (EEP) superfamily protein YafD
VLCGLPALVATYLRVLPPTDDGPALFASFISYAVLGYLLALVFFLVALARARRRAALGLLTTMTAGLLALHLCWLAPLFVSDDRPSATPGFTLMSLNTLYGAADPQQVWERARRADVVVLLEATTSGVRQLSALGWDERFPYSAGTVGGGVGDTTIYSRFPITDQARLPQSKFQQWVLTVSVPRLGAVRVIGAHPCNPFCGGNQFDLEHRELRAEALRNLDGPLVVAGDLNAVDDHAPLLALRRDGLESVTDIVGAGWLPTYPANRRIPPLLPIDHILVNRYLTATSVATFRVDGTDHLGLISTLAGARR